MIEANSSRIKPMAKLLNIFHILVLSYASIVPFLDIVARTIFHNFSIRLLVQQYPNKPRTYCAYWPRQLYGSSAILLHF